MRINCRMNKRLFLERVQSRMTELQIRSERALLLKAGVSVDVLRKMRSGQHTSLNMTTAQKIADALEAPLAWLTGEQHGWVTVSSSERTSQGLAEPVDVVGQVQAGTWVEAVEWDAAERYTMLLPRDARHPGLKRFGFKVLGSSMDKLFPHGAIVMAVKLADLGGAVPNRSTVIVHAKRHDLWEATCKVYVERPDGSVWLEPRSTDAKFRPIPMPAGDGPGAAKKARDLDTVEIFGVVTGAYIEQ
jgi:SOS-response transcriptional repressor LexA